MNSDFIQPNKTNTPEQTPVNDVSDVSDTSNTAATDTSSPVEAEQSTQSPVFTSEKPKKGHPFLTWLLVLLALALVGAGVYYWQHNKVQSLRTSQAGLTTQVASLKAQVAKEKTSSSSMDMPDTMSSSADVMSVVTGAPSKVTTSEADVVANYLMGKTMATEVWIESGLQPDKLSTVSSHVKTSGEGTAGMYAGNSVALTGLKAGTTYFYRAAGMVNGKTVDGGIVSFTTTK